MRLPFTRRTQPTGPTVEERDAFSGIDRVPSWAEISSAGGYSPVPVTKESAVGLPAAGRAITLVAETIASLPCRIYQGYDADKRARRDLWQHQLLHDLPGMGDFTTFDFYSDISACVDASGNAFLQKVKAGGQVVALLVIDPARVSITREGGEKRFAISADGRTTNYSAGDIIHIRGFTLTGADIGLSPISLHRTRLGAISAAEQHVGRFYGQGVTKRVALQYPNKLNKEQAKIAAESFKAVHTGTQNAHLPAILTDGATLGDFGMTLEDAQYIESERLNLVQAAHIFRIPPKFLTGEGDLNEWDFIAFLQGCVQPRLARIERALHSDPDLFPDRTVYPEFDTSKLIRTDAKTKAEVQHMQVQDGTRLVDEIRAEEGLPPLPPIPDDPSLTPGMVPQLTPVGGAPNPQGNSNEPQQNTMVVRELAQPAQPIVAVQFPEQQNHHHHHINLEASPPPDVHVHPAQVTVETPKPADVHVTTPDVRVDAPITVQAAPAPDVHVAPAEVRLEPHINVEAPAAPDVHVTTPDVHVAPAEVRVEPAQVTVEAPPPAQVQVDVAAAPAPDLHVEVHPPAPGRRTVQFSDGRTATIEENED